MSMQMISADQITGLILAGGRGTRMGGVDKGLQLFRGAPMALQVIERLAPQVGRLAINANQNQAAYISFGLPVWPDVISGFAGPLAGLQAGLSHCETPFLVTAPCDSPFLPSDLVSRLSQALTANRADVAVAATGEGNNRQAHPVFCLVRASVLAHLTEFLSKGGRKVDAWYASLAVEEVHFADENAFMNINTAEELKRSETL